MYSLESPHGGNLNEYTKYTLNKPPQILQKSSKFELSIVMNYLYSSCRSFTVYMYRTTIQAIHQYTANSLTINRHLTLLNQQKPNSVFIKKRKCCNPRLVSNP